MICASERSRVAILAFAASIPIFAFAHWPIRTPARKLSVANVASAASAGSKGVSSAITRRPASRARRTVSASAPGSDGVIRIPFAPAATRLSIAAT